MNTLPLADIVEVEQGKLQGRIAVNYNGDKFMQFFGIPYGNVSERFKLAEPPLPWKGIRDATKEHDGCYRRHFLTKEITGEENCLYLNVYSKMSPDSDLDLKPVMFWIQGGGFVTGSGGTALQGPEMLLTEDIVLVTSTHRIGIIGFLNYEDPSLPTTKNLGLKDQRLAFQWIQKNINRFGGDPNNVTLFGISSGACAIQYHMMSKDSEGLFHKAIIQSGSVMGVFAQGDINIIKVVEVMGYKVQSEKEAFDILLKAPIEEIYRAQETFPKFVMPDTRRVVGPMVEFPGTPLAIFTEPAIDIIASGVHNDVPCMLGYTADEGLFIEKYPTTKPDIKSASDCEVLVPYMMNVDKGSELSKLLSEMIYKQYFERGGDYNRNVYDVITDSLYRTYMVASIKQQVKTSKHPVFAYKITIETKLNMKHQLALTEEPGVGHGDEMGYLFKVMYTPEIEKDSIEDVSWRRFVKLWTNFAKYGNPTPKESMEEDKFGIIWEPATNPEQIKTLVIGEELKMETNPNEDQVEFWRNIFRHSPYTSKYM